jgi:hypothetical protein
MASIEFVTCQLRRWRRWRRHEGQCYQASPSPSSISVDSKDSYEFSIVTMWLLDLGGSRSCVGLSTGALVAWAWLVKSGAKAPHSKVGITHRLL